jgi:hypothetical protein
MKVKIVKCSVKNGLWNEKIGEVVDVADFNKELLYYFMDNQNAILKSDCIVIEEPSKIKTGKVTSSDCGSDCVCKDEVEKSCNNCANSGDNNETGIYCSLDCDDNYSCWVKHVPEVIEKSCDNCYHEKDDECTNEFDCEYKDFSGWKPKHTENKLEKVEKIKAEKGFKIKIISSTADDWYSNRIGTYYVIDTIGQSSYYLSDGRYVNKIDCEVFKPKQDHIVEPNKKVNCLKCKNLSTCKIEVLGYHCPKFEKVKKYKYVCRECKYTPCKFIVIEDILPIDCPYGIANAEWKLKESKE